MSAESTLKLPEELSIANVAEWKSKLSSLLHEPSPLTLAADELSRVDTAAIQLLAAFAVKVQASDMELQWNNPSDALKKTAKQLGMLQSLVLD